MFGNQELSRQQGGSRDEVMTPPSPPNTAPLHQSSESFTARSTVSRPLVWDLLSAGGPHASYFKWEDWMHQTRQHPLWHVPISVSNSPGFAAFISNLTPYSSLFFQRVFHGDPWGSMSHSFLVTQRRWWYQQTLSATQQDMFRTIIRYRAAAIQTTEPDMQKTGMFITRVPGEPAMMLHEALEAIGSSYDPRILPSGGNSVLSERVTSAYGGLCRFALPTSYSAPSLRLRADRAVGNRAGDGAFDFGSYTTYCLRFGFFIISSYANVNVSQIFQRWWRFRSLVCDQGQPGQALRRLSR